MGSLSIALACDADLCALYPKVRKIRESMTIERATELFETNKPLTNERLLEGTLKKKVGALTPTGL